jgi:hypothetical protein
MTAGELQPTTACKRRHRIVKTSPLFRIVPTAVVAPALALLLAGCASDGDKSPSSPNKFLADDGRTIDIGRSVPADGGTRYDDPHLEKGKCWVAEGFNFTGYDTLYIVPTASTAKYPDKPEDTMVHNLAKENLVSEWVRKLNERKLFANVVTRESDIKPGARVLRLENTITEFSKGGGGARYFAGLYGGGQPVLRVQGRVLEGDKVLFTYEALRSGTSGGARMGGAFMKDEDIQLEDVRSMVLDLTDFMAAVAGKYPPKT